MRLYRTTLHGKFIDRPNRFIAHVEIEGNVETVHVKNTGRCKELLLPGVKVILSVSDTPVRKTKYDLVAVYKEGLGLINMDSQAPNQVVYEYLKGLSLFDYIKPEYTYGSSRVDFYMEKDNEKYLLEIKGCTLEKDGIGFFPDAPTVRGVKHLHELALACKNGYHCGIGFVVQMEGITSVYPNTKTDPAFTAALMDAVNAGVKIFILECEVSENALRITRAHEQTELSLSM